MKGGFKMGVGLFFVIVFTISIVVFGQSAIAQEKENLTSPYFSSQESNSFILYYDPSVYSKREIRIGLKLLEKFLKEECAKSSFCHLPDNKIPIIYLNEKGPDLGSSVLRGYI